ncbi:MAG: hypothetical protein ACI4WG_06595 [Erysipelotrichaceae bacterium]
MKRIIVILAIMAVFFAMTGCNSASMNQSDNSQFDYYVECTTKKQLEELENEPFVDSIFSFSLLIFEYPNKASVPSKIVYYATSSFEKIDTSSFDRAAIIKEDTAILSNYECNPIIISSSLADDEHLSIGDTIEQPCKLTEQPLTFTIGAIYKHDSLFAQYEAIILLNEANNAVLLSVVDEAGYSNAYIKASDPEKLKYYFEEEFVPGMLYQNYNPDEIATLTREEISSYYEDYQTHIKRMK